MTQLPKPQVESEDCKCSCKEYKTRGYTVAVDGKLLHTDSECQVQSSMIFSNGTSSWKTKNFHSYSKTMRC